MLRYRLDDLGPYQFEKLSQSALKSLVGLGVESWGNRGDWGRDAYAPGSLKFPDPSQVNAGPFIFQTKFIEGANAAGARPKSALLSSASKEVARINERIANRKWQSPRFFTFITNSLLDAAVREKVREIFKKALVNTEVLVWGGDDVCDVLDRRSAIARAFPQLLSIRDLDTLIKTALNTESRARSDTALQLAAELVPIFTSTSSYERTWKLLRKHHFAVLEGPPEVGKSAIAWMVGLTQAAEGWETIVCRTPDVFFQTIETSQPQIFIADDAFGRTEYDPTRTTKWEADLDLVLHRLDPRHWLIWTSRKHILERACEKMDAQGKARSFPDPGAVLVDVSELSVEERALILFRHSKSAGLEAAARKLVREHASQIVGDPEFTPERIRRFVREGLPSIVTEMTSVRIAPEQVRLAVKEALRNPTKQMRLTFEKLLPAYKWFLVALLEIPEPEGQTRVAGNVDKLQSIYETYCPEADYQPFESIMEHLTEAFVKVRKTDWRGIMVDWIHPSYRDLVIEELIQNVELRNRFLGRASLEGVKLAVSDTGGQHGHRKLPLIRSAESWDVLQERCLALIKGNGDDQEVLEILANAASQNPSQDLDMRWNRLLNLVCEAVRQKWNAELRLIDAGELNAFSKARKHAVPEPPLPELRHTWESLEAQFKEAVRHAEAHGNLDFESLDDLAHFAQVTKQLAPEFLDEMGFPARYDSEIAAIVLAAEAEAKEDSYESDPDALRELAGRKDAVAASIERLSDLDVPQIKSINRLSSRLRTSSSRLEREAAENEPPDPDYEYERTSSDESVIFDIGRLFSEL